MEKLRRLEKISRILDPLDEQKNELLEKTIQFSEEFIASLPEAKAYNNSPDNAGAMLDFPITEEGKDIDKILKCFGDNVVSTGLNPTSGRFLGYIPGGGLFHSALGDYLAAVTNRYSGVFFANPGAVRIENMLLRWMAEVIGYPEDSAGYLASGGSIANLSAIVVARDEYDISGAKVENAVVYITEHVHHCIQKALKIAGLAKCECRVVPVDKGFRMKPDSLDELIKKDEIQGKLPWLIIASAGTTNTGSVDPLEEIKAIAEKHNLWYHVDGAYGALFQLCPEGKEVLRGMELSDSIVMDPHKTLFLPYGTGALLVRDKQKLFESHNVSADYMQDTLDAVGELSPADLSPELTKHFRGLRMWLPLQIAGVKVFRAALSEKILLARYFYDKIQTIDGFEVGPYPDLSVVTYRYVPDNGKADLFNELLMKELLNDGRIFISSTRINGKFVLRLAVGCFRTHLDEIEETIQILESTSKKIRKNL